MINGNIFVHLYFYEKPIFIFDSFLHLLICFSISNFCLFVGQQLLTDLNSVYNTDQIEYGLWIRSLQRYETHTYHGFV